MKKNNKNVTKTAGGSNQPVIVQEVTVRPFNRQSLDLTKWKNAATSAEGLVSRRVLLYELYHDVTTTDGQIIAVSQKRIDAVTRAQWLFTDKEGNPVDEINQLLDCVGFDDLLTEVINSRFWGYSMVEPTFFVNDNEQNEFSLYSIPKKHMRPNLGIVAKEQSSDEGINIREGLYAKTIMEFGKADDLGLLLSAAYYAILKRNDISDYAEFIEIFGRGIIDATWDGFDEAQRQKLASAFKEMGGGGVIIRPDGTEMKIHNNTGNANGELQKGFAQLMDTYISIVLLGTTETTNSSASSGYAQSKTHQEQDENKNETDLNYVRRNLNSRFIKVLKASGFDTKGGTFVLKKVRKPNKEAFEIHLKMAQDLKIPIDDDFFYEEYGVPKPKNYEAMKKALLEQIDKALAQKEALAPADTPPPKKVKKEKTPSDLKTKLSLTPKWLLRLFQSAPVAITGATTCQCGETHTINPAYKAKDFDIEALAHQINQADGKAYLYPSLFYLNAENVIKGFESGWDAKSESVKLAVGLGFEYNVTDPKIKTAWELNLFKFSAGKAAYQSAEVNAIFRESKSFDDFYKTLKKKYSSYENGVLIAPNKQYLQTEYNTANAVGESAATYFRLLKQTATFKYWKYATANDERVRPEHALLQNLVFAWNDTIWDKIFPPNGWGCRCYVTPLMESEVTPKMLEESKNMAKSFFESEEWAKSLKNGFGINRANTTEVFTKSQQYSDNPEKVLTDVGKLYHDNWGIKPILTKQEEATTNFVEAESRDIIQEFYREFKISNSKMLLKDYNNRDVILQKNRLQGHTTDNDKYGDRFKYLPAVADILKNPDEVWIYDNGDRFDTYGYIKFYKNGILKVVAKLTPQGDLEMQTWYKLSLTDLTNANKALNDLYRHRRGLLVKK